MHILLTRPEPQARAMQATLEAMGHRVTLAPLLDIELLTPPVDLDGVQALAITSKNAVRALFEHPARAQIAALPLLAVGSGTAAAARAAGFHVALEAGGDGASLAAHIPQTFQPDAGAVLHASGDVIAFDLASALAPSGFDVRRTVVYRSVPTTALPDPVHADLKERLLDAVILMSPRTARTWMALTEAAGLADQSRKLVHLCLSEAVAAPVRARAGLDVRVAVQPNSEEMLALARQLSSSSGR